MSSCDLKYASMRIRNKSHRASVWGWDVARVRYIRVFKRGVKG